MTQILWYFQWLNLLCGKKNDRKAIPGHNSGSLSYVTLQKCKEFCMSEQPSCRSIEYYLPGQYCQLGDVTFGDPGIHSRVDDPRVAYYSFCELGESHIPDTLCSEQIEAETKWTPFRNIFKCIFLNENGWILLEISIKFVPKGPINNILALV